MIWIVGYLIISVIFFILIVATTYVELDDDFVPLIFVFVTTLAWPVAVILFLGFLLQFVFISLKYKGEYIIEKRRIKKSNKKRG